jgi:hypothetical protein
LSLGQLKSVLNSASDHDVANTPAGPGETSEGTAAQDGRPDKLCIQAS